MQVIADLLTRDLSQSIEEVVKLDQQDEKTVHTEITEYVVTDRLLEQYERVLKAIADAPGDPTEGVGVWVSGFFGSGKSFFAKNLGYILANRTVLGRPAAQLFLQQLEQQAPNHPTVKRIADLLHFVNARFQSQVIMFDVQVDRAVRRATEPIAEIMYTVLLRELGYSTDYDIAELEIELEAERQLADFVKVCAKTYGSDTPSTLVGTVPVTLAGVKPAQYAVWQRVRAGAQRVQRASAVLHELAPQVYPSQDSWAATLHGDSDITIRTLVERTFELTARRRPGHAVIFIIDEVGQYVARSADKIENLRAVVEQFGKEGKNRVSAGQAVAPVWVIVTSQEKLDEVVAAIDDKRVELARLQDRFVLPVDMAPSDIREVATRRVLAKKPAAEERLREMYDQAAPVLKTHTRLEHTGRGFGIEREAFVQFYPYLPHFVDISIDIVSGIRLQPGAPRHIGGSNRTIIKQAYEMLVDERTKLGQAPIGTLVTLDRIYDLVEGNLSSEKRRDISEIDRTWPSDPWPTRVAKSVVLLEYVRDLPRSEENLAALLYRAIGDESPIAEVRRAVEELRKHDFIRLTDSGWKLQSAQEKNWATQRNALTPTPRERNEILEDRLRAIFSEPSLTRYRYRNLRTFRVGVTWEGRVITSGEDQIPLALRVAEGPEALGKVTARAREDSRAQPHENEVFWVMSLNEQVDEVVTELYRSRQMVVRYDQLSAGGKITNEESASLAAEKAEVLRLEERLKGLAEAALAGGESFFRGVRREGASLGKALSEILRALYELVVPDLYPKLEMGARPLSGKEAEEILRAANLNGLSKVFYGPPDGLELVAKEGNRYVTHIEAPIAKEVRAYLATEYSYSKQVTGKTLEAHFGGIGYGWDREMIWLVLATLLRGGAIEVSHQGRRYRDHLDAQVRAVFSGTNAFRAASFAPRKTIDLKTLVDAAQRYEAITGDAVDVEESAIAQAFQKLAGTELAALIPVEAIVQANSIPIAQVLQEYHATLETVLSSASDDVVNMLAGEGATFQEQRDRVVAIRKATDAKGLARLRRLRNAVQQMWPVLQIEADVSKLVEQAQELGQRLAGGTYYQAAAEVDRAYEAIEQAYHQLYEGRHEQRRAIFQEAIDQVKGLPNWPLVPEEQQGPTLKALTDRVHDVDRPKGDLTCRTCAAGLAQLASDIAAVDALRSAVLMRVQKLTAPEEKVERVRVTDIVGIGRSLSTEKDVEELIEQLQERLLKLLSAGVKVMLE